MSIFNSVKGILDVVANNQITGQSGTMLWKHPSPAIASGSRLIVGESQEAILVKSGKIIHVFDTGAYELNTQNMPFLQGFLNLPFGGKTPHPAEVWFVNKSIQMEVPWGTPSPIKVEDKIYEAILDIRSNGSISVKVTNSRNLFTAIAGQVTNFSLEELKKKTKSIVISRITDVLVKFVMKEEKSFTELNGHLLEIGEFMTNALSTEFQRYGLEIDGCYIQKIEPVDNDNLKEIMALKKEKKRRMDLAQVQAYEEQTIESTRIQNEKRKMAELGYDYRTEKQFDVIKTAASNSGNPMVSGGMGFGIGAGLGKMAAQQISSMSDELLNGNEKQQPPASQEGNACPSCGEISSKEVKFCGNCGSSLKKQCLQCRHTIEGTVKFCPECGKKLQFCPNCLADNEADAEICQRCETVLVQKPIQCQDCGYEVISGTKFCPECGKKLI
ncbi:MAG: SPFH domain-containing protein [Clostridiaceae bacterium]|nr:SPFH domain-containing protein [Clostridiaceae bacterium]